MALSLGVLESVNDNRELLLEVVGMGNKSCVDKGPVAGGSRCRGDNVVVEQSGELLEECVDRVAAGVGELCGESWEAKGVSGRANWSGSAVRFETGSIGMRV